ncbi:MAG: carbamoyltransferase HypF [Archaeoglobaceae archaeon]|nr:carbamoyltransferase HypF [Archaeoglobaceae archaeon]MDW8117539.1 carbamoyltransferase HypF [Archaeoglobaceae archaeon]
MLKALRIKLIGIVQGVGLRPFVYRIALANSISGYVRNLGGSEVEIFAEGSHSALNSFIESLKKEKPPFARFDKLIIEDVKPAGYTEFKILKSDPRFEERSIIPPDFAICKDCIEEVLNLRARFYRYHWNSCAWCGARFSMLYRIPYDRENTAMIHFPLCEECSKEYADHRNLRRFHAQGISCPNCGPKTFVYDIKGKKLEVDDVINFTAEKILEGKIFAIKGIGGYHIACLASDDSLVLELRKRKMREKKPFALMARDYSVVERIANPPNGAKELLESPERPIVIMPKKNSAVSEFVAPGLSTIGIMLPYSAFQVLLLKEIPDGFLIMTSGNLHGKPMCKSLEEVFSQLSGIVDYVVEHEREILHRVDDSVMRFTDSEPIFLRRGRGYAPEWINICKKLPEGIALGAELQTAGAISFEDKVVLTQFIGDLDEVENLEAMKNEFKWFMENYHIKPEFIALDMHPLYHNRKLLKELPNASVFEIQHHHAHAVSAFAELGLEPEEKALAITIDGTGYGDDGTIWGGELLIANWKEYRRVGSFRPFNLPGGDSSAKYPVKCLIALMSSYGFGEEEILGILKERDLSNSLPYGLKEAEITCLLARKGKGVMTTSLGRILDAFSALLNVCTERTYEGEPPMRLEAIADNGRDLCFTPEVRRGDRTLIDVRNLLEFAIQSEAENADIARTVLQGIGRALGSSAILNLKNSDYENVIVTGGAGVNTYIVKGIKEVLISEGIEVILPKKTPLGDGGIALGQILIASSKLAEDLVNRS